MTLVRVSLSKPSNDLKGLERGGMAPPLSKITGYAMFSIYRIRIVAT